MKQEEQIIDTSKKDILTFEDVKKLTDLVFIPSGYVVQLKDLENNILWEDSNTLNRKGDRVGYKCYKENFGRSAPCPHCTAKESIKSMVPQIKEDRNLIDGKWYRVVAIPILLTEEYAAIELIQDITGEKIRDQTLDSILSKDSLTSNIVRHDLPNYLNLINVALEGISDKKLTKDETKQFLKIAKSNTQRTLDVLKDLHQLSDFEDPLADLKRINILLVLEKVLAEVKSMFPDRIINSRLHKNVDFEEAVIWGNTLISEIFVNIFTNSVKYTPSNKVDLEIIVSKVINEQEYIEFQITDFGKGISPEIKEVIFDRAERMKRGWKPSTTSTGLGSTIIKSLVDIFGGEIEYSSRLEEDWTKGTSISLRFPQALVNREN
ncbi:MAG: sensor histidine kinase [Candidatus Hodarchaeales archaeon]